MAAVSKGDNIFIATGAEGARKMRAQAQVALVAGDPVDVSSQAPSDTRFPFVVNKAGTVEQCFAVVLDKSVAVGDPVDILVNGELEGFTGLTRGAKLSVVSGAIDTTAPVSGITPQFVAISTTGIVKLF